MSDRNTGEAQARRNATSLEEQCRGILRDEEGYLRCRCVEGHEGAHRAIYDNGPDWDDKHRRADRVSPEAPPDEVREKAVPEHSGHPAYCPACVAQDEPAPTPPGLEERALVCVAEQLDMPTTQASTTPRRSS